MSDSHRFGPFEVQPTQRKLLREGQALPIGSRAFDLLLALIERPDRLVTKSELLDAAWPGLVVEEANVQVQVSALRRLLGASAIATVPGLGYRFAMPTDRPSAASSAHAPPGARPAFTNLPSSLASLIGRERDLCALASDMAQNRLVTVLGPGGIGKTRVAQEAASRQLGAHANGIWWVDLAALGDAEHLCAAIANAAQLTLGDGVGAIEDLLLRSLAPRDCLLVLDNCEHLSAALGPLVTQVLRCSPDVRLLVTSQEVLHVSGERVYRLGPLAVPLPGAALEDARRYSAVQLFEQRAQAIDRRFALDAASVGSAIALLHQLDGQPLAIEMAAARVPLLGVTRIGERLADWSRMFQNRSHGLPVRHQTLLGMLEWSYSLLSLAEQRVLQALSLFAGSFCIDTVQRALQGSGLDDWAVLDALSALVDKSLVQVEQVEPPRYRLLETMRRHAGEQLKRSDHRACTQQQHDAALAALADRVESSFWELPDRLWLARHAPDYDDLQAAFDRACQRQDAAAAGRTGMALMRLDHLRSLNALRWRRAEALHALLPGASLQARACIWTCIASHGLIALDVVTRREASRQAVAAWRQLGDPPRLHFALGFHAAECSREHDFGAADLALAEAQALEDPGWPLRRRHTSAAARAGVCIHRNDAAGYRAASRDELALAEQAGADRAAAWARLKLADAALMAGDFDESIALGRDAVAELAELDQPSNLGLALTNLCTALALSGHTAAAVIAAARALPLMWRNGWGYLVLDSVALLAALGGHMAVAAQLLGHADAWYSDHGDLRQPNEATLARRCAALLEAALGSAGAEAARAAEQRSSDAEVEAKAAAVLATLAHSF